MKCGIGTLLRTILWILLVIGCIKYGFIYLKEHPEFSEIFGKHQVDVETENLSNIMENDQKVVREQAKNKVDQVFDSSIVNEPILKTGVLGNYEPIIRSDGNGPGEGGLPVYPTPDEEAAVQASVNEYGFNMVVSDKISLHRRAKDFRPNECKYWTYPTKLPKASVIIVFLNEGWSTLIRTIHSVIDTIPPELLEEIILVDDFSTKKHLKQDLDDYILLFNGKVKLLRTTKHEGLIRSRVIGAQHAVGEALVILDAHIECQPNWLVPLLTRIAINRKALAVPIVDRIDWYTFEHRTYKIDRPHVGIFEWGFLYKEMIATNYPNHPKNYETEPYWSPTHAGGLFAIEKNWFFELGGYDSGIKIWGGEQYELSFKVWQCGGVIEWVTCSRVAHVYRGPRKEVYHRENKNPFQTDINHIRVAQVWMDEYKEHFYTRHPQFQKLPFGNISEQLELRKRLECKPFKWYMENIAYEMLNKFPFPPKNKVWGYCVNKNFNVCLDLLDTTINDPIGVEKCHERLGKQFFRLNIKGELSNGEHCLVSDDDIVRRKQCIKNGVWNAVGEWDYIFEKNQIKSNKINKCLETDGKNIWLDDCKDNEQTQKWYWTEVYVV